MAVLRFISIKLPATEFERAREVAERLGISRSTLVRAALVLARDAPRAKLRTIVADLPGPGDPPGFIGVRASADEAIKAGVLAARLEVPRSHVARAGLVLAAEAKDAALREALNGLPVRIRPRRRAAAAA